MSYLFVFNCFLVGLYRYLCVDSCIKGIALYIHLGNLVAPILLKMNWHLLGGVGISGRGCGIGGLWIGRLGAQGEGLFNTEAR